MFSRSLPRYLKAPGLVDVPLLEDLPRQARCAARDHRGSGTYTDQEWHRHPLNSKGLQMHGLRGTTGRVLSRLARSARPEGDSPRQGERGPHRARRQDVLMSPSHDAAQLRESVASFLGEEHQPRSGRVYHGAQNQSWSSVRATRALFPNCGEHDEEAAGLPKAQRLSQLLLPCHLSLVTCLFFPCLKKKKTQSEALLTNTVREVQRPQPDRHTQRTKP